MTVEWLDMDMMQSGEDAFITVNPIIGTKRLYISSVASYLLGYDTKWIKVGFDQENKKLIFKPLDERLPEALKITPASNRDNEKSKLILKSKLINFVADVTGIDDTYRFPAEWNDEKEYLEINLNKKVEVDFDDGITDFSETAYN